MNHNVDKQISDSRGEVAYLMADVSNVQLSDIKEIHDGLEGLSCKFLADLREHSGIAVLMIRQRAYWSVYSTRCAAFM